MLIQNTSIYYQQSDHLGYIAVELSAPIQKVSDKAEQFFPGLSQVCSSKAELYERNIQELTLEKADIEKSWGLWLGQRKVYIRWGSVLAGCVIGVGAGVPLFIYVNHIAGGIITGIAPVNAMLSFTFYNTILDIYPNKLKTNGKGLEKAEKDKQWLEAIISFTNQMGEFEALWKNFAAAPSEKKVKPLFEALQQILRDYDQIKVYELNFLHQDLIEYFKNYQISNQFIENGIHVFDKISYLFLMEDVCKQLKSGSLVHAWRQLKITPFQNAASLSPRISPWTDLGMENPASNETYLQFFDKVNQNESLVFAETLQKCFQRVKTEYFSKLN